MRTLPLTLLIALLVPSALSAQVLRVRAGAPPGGDGSSWAQAFGELQSALASATAGTQVWLATGTYRPHASDRTVSFVVPDGVAVYGGFAGSETSLAQRDPLANLALLDGDLNGDDLPGLVNYGDNSQHVVTAAGVQSVRLDGFTVRGGSLGGGAGIRITGVEAVLANLVVRENHGLGNNNDGAGVWLGVQSVSATNCRFLDNRTTAGGGVYLYDPPSAGPKDALFVGCTFERNTATNGAGVLAAGIEPWDLVLRECTFRDGFATSGAGLSTSAGGSTLLAEACAFEANAACAGGALYLPNTSGRIDHCRFEGNGARGGCGLGTGGGGIRLGGSGVMEIDGSLFHDDSRSSLWVEAGASALASFSTFHGVSTAAIRVKGGDVQLDHCIVWGTPDLQVAVGPGTVAATYSDVRMNGAGLPGLGNLDLDPLFVDAAAGDLHLAPGSPCIDAGDPLPILIGEDFERDSRILDGDLNGSLRLDMGADEHALLHLEVLGPPAAGRTLTFVTSGPASLAGVLYLGRPGARFVPQAGVAFLNTLGLVHVPWPSPPSSVPVLVPPGLSGVFHVQELGFGGGLFTLSNYAELQF